MAKKLDEFEYLTLLSVMMDNTPDDPGAAFWGAVENLALCGYLRAGEVTPEGLLAMENHEIDRMAKEGL